MSWAVIFDMNGVLIDDMGFHKQAWQIYRRRLGDKLSLENMDQDLTGRTNLEIFSILLGRDVTEAECLRLEEEKEGLYRRIYQPHLKEVSGLKRVLQQLKADDVPLALATSAPAANVDFILDGLQVRSYFDVIVDAGQITRGKPDPEIFLTAADKLGVPPNRCVVFEDSHLGIQGARRAGMQVIGITTTHPAEDLQGPLFSVADFTGITPEQLKSAALAG